MLFYIRVRLIEYVNLSIFSSFHINSLWSRFFFSLSLNWFAIHDPKIYLVNRTMLIMHSKKKNGILFQGNLYSWNFSTLFYFLLQRIVHSCWQMLKSSSTQSSIAMRHFARWAVSVVLKSCKKPAGKLQILYT